MHIKRFCFDLMGKLLAPGKVLALYGPRRAGKTTLLRDFMAGYPGRAFIGNGDERSVRDILMPHDAGILKSAFAGYDLVIIDEAQAVPSVGLALKVLVDHFPGLRVIASGSSSFQLAGDIGEPLTGRKTTLTLYPVSAGEVAAQAGNMEMMRRKEEFLIYGLYPEVLTTESASAKAALLTELCDAYLFKDILAFAGIRHSEKLSQLVSLLAFQIGKEVSLTEIASRLQINRQTVERYLDLLGKTFVVYPLSGYSRNLRREITKTKRYYFYDNGILNAVMNNFNPISKRADAGALWENFLAAERLKKQGFAGSRARNFFWRTYDGQEVDWVEEQDGRLAGFEFKYGERAPSAPKAWRAAYPGASFEAVNSQTFPSFIL